PRAAPRPRPQHRGRAHGHARRRSGHPTADAHLRRVEGALVRHRGRAAAARGVSARGVRGRRPRLTRRPRRRFITRTVRRPLTLAVFVWWLVMPAATFTASGTSDGHRLEVRYGTGDRQDTLAIPLAEPIHLATTFRPRIAAARPAPGTRFTHAVFSPLTLRSEPVTTVVEGR